MNCEENLIRPEFEHQRSNPYENEMWLLTEQAPIRQWVDGEVIITSRD